MITAYVTPDRPERFTTDSRPDMLELLLGETALVRSDRHPIIDVSIVAAPEGEHQILEDVPVSITPAAVGRYHLRIRTMDGVDTDVSLIVCETDALASIPATNNAGDIAVDKRRVLRELGRFVPSFTGLASQIHTQNLANFGA